MLNLVWALHLLFAQAESTEPDLRCGSYCLYVSLKALDFPVGTFEELEERLGQPSYAGYSLMQLSEAARSYGAETLGVETTIENLQRRTGPFACIALLRPAHFVNLADVDDREVYVVDPPRDYLVPVETFETQWSGKALLIAATPLVPEEALNRSSPLWKVLIVVGVAFVLILGFAVVRRAKAG